MSENIVLLVGASGSGKTTVAEILENEYGLKQIQSYTTRPRRRDDERGHIFVTDDEFDQLEDFVGFTNFNGYRYAATAQQVEENDIYVIDPAGVSYFRNAYHGSKQPVVVHIYADRQTRENRMRFRGDSEEAIQSRLVNDETAFRFVDADQVVVNMDDPIICADKVFQIYTGAIPVPDRTINFFVR